MRMSRKGVWLLVVLAAGGWLVAGDAVLQGAERKAVDIPGMEVPEGKKIDEIRKILDGEHKPKEEKAAGWADLLKPWKQLKDPPTLAGLLIAFALATALSALIAYHPRSYGKARSLSDVESPKTYIVYSMVGAVCGQVVIIEPSLAFLIFGLGGLMRFRTDVGAAKDTGRVILVTLIGLCCGLLRYDIAVLSTAFAYGLISVLEGGTAYRVVVKGLSEESIVPAADAYREILDEEGCRILNEKKNFVKHTVRFTFRAPRGVDHEDLEQSFEDSIPSELKGSSEWQSS